MANELTISANLSYSDSENTELSLAVANAIFNVVTKGGTRLRQNIGLSQVALNLGGVSAPGWCFIVNRDQTNSVDIKVATGGAIFARLDPDTALAGLGGFCLLKLGAGAQVPFAIANVAACDIDILILPT